jgi:hypothetical protein
MHLNFKQHDLLRKIVDLSYPIKFHTINQVGNMFLMPKYCNTMLFRNNIVMEGHP